MKLIILVLTLLTLIVSPGYTAEPTKHIYQGEIAGVVCVACASKVKADLAKLPGVQGVEITKGDKPSVNKLIITSTSASITKEAAIKALGDDAMHYSILSLSPAKDQQLNH